MQKGRGVLGGPLDWGVGSSCVWGEGLNYLQVKIIQPWQETVQVKSQQHFSGNKQKLKTYAIENNHRII